jgi:siroheme synthase (precorrin-2 oxidase/ferrochelatase)
MYPIILGNLRIVVIGSGNAANRRKAQFDKMEIKYTAVDNLDTLTPNPSPKGEGSYSSGVFFSSQGDEKNTPNTFTPLSLGRGAGGEGFLPFDIAFVNDFDDAASLSIRHKLKLHKILVNVEDKKELCDFYVPAIHKTGDLIIAVSSSGKSPSLAIKVRDYIAEIYDSSWKEKLDGMAEKRDIWRDRKLSLEKVAELSRAFLNKKGWFK